MTLKTILNDLKSIWLKNTAQSITSAYSGDRVYSRLKRTHRYQAQLQIDELERAILLAENPDYFNRTVLYAIYKEVARDRHIYGNIRTLILKIVGSPFAVFEKGSNTIDKDATVMLQTPWFENYRNIYHWTPWWAHTLVEFQEMVKSQKKGLDYEFKKLRIIPREHVMPQLGLITIYPQDSTKGIKFREKPFNTWLMEIGDEDDLGLFQMAAEEYIWKRYSRVDWSRHSEKFGTPLLSINTSTKNEKELDKIEDMAANFGANGYVILDNEDKISIVGSSRIGESYKMYQEKIRECNNELSKLISGQTLTSGSDGKGSYALGKVHADVLSEYQEHGMRSETYHINGELFPFLIRHGYPLEGKEFRHLAFMNEGKEANSNKGKKRRELAPEDRVVTFNY